MPTSRDLTTTALAHTARLVAAAPRLYDLEIDEDEWSDDPEYAAALEAIIECEPDIAAKLDALRAVRLRLDAECSALRAEEWHLAERRRALGRSADRLGETGRLLLAALPPDRDGRQKTRGTHSHWLQASESIQGPDNPKDWPESCRRVRYEPDREAARALLDQGAELPGVSVVRSMGWRSR
jgi:hypothetical protein